MDLCKDFDISNTVQQEMVLGIFYVPFTYFHILFKHCNFKVLEKGSYPLDPTSLSLDGEVNNDHQKIVFNRTICLLIQAFMATFSLGSIINLSRNFKESAKRAL